MKTLTFLFCFILVGCSLDQDEQFHKEIEEMVDRTECPFSKFITPNSN